MQAPVFLFLRLCRIYFAGSITSSAIAMLPIPV
jgi:hypothetical protein